MITTGAKVAGNELISNACGWVCCLGIPSLGLYLWYRSRKPKQQRMKVPDLHESLDGQVGVVTNIAWGGGNASPSVLVAAAKRALKEGDYERALELAQRARNRNDDFVNALPGMSGRPSLRIAIYHPTLYAAMIHALHRCQETGLINAQVVANVALEEWRWMERDYPTLHGSGDNTYWHLYLSEYLYLFALAFASGVTPTNADPHELDIGIARAVAESAKSVPSGSLTKRGQLGKARIYALVSWPQPAKPATYLGRPASADHLPCGQLITQDEIAHWLKREQNEPSELDLDTETLPTYAPSRPRAPYPSGATMVQLRDLCIQQVGKAQSNPDAWWLALDYAVYRWELMHRYDEDATELVSTIAYDTYAIKERAEVPNTPLWDWQSIVDMFRYCLQRIEALAVTVDPQHPDDLRGLQGARNRFASFLYYSLRAGGQTAALNAFEPQLFAILDESHPQTLTAAQIAILPALREKYGSRDLHS